MKRDLVALRNHCLYQMICKYDISIKDLIKLNVFDVCRNGILKYEILRKYLEYRAECKIENEKFQRILNEPLFITASGGNLCRVSARRIILFELSK